MIKKGVLLEGVLDISPTNFIKPIDCHQEPMCDIRRSFIYHTGIAKTKTGATSIGVIEHTLKHLNGKWVRLTLEVEMPALDEMSDGQQHPPTAKA